MVEQRVIGQKIGARPAAPAMPAPERSPEPSAPTEKPKRRRPPRLVVVIVAVVVVLGAAAAAYLMLGRSGGGPAEPKPAPTPVAGQVVAVDAVSVNLAGGHYLRLGLALQLSTDAGDTPDTARVLDLAIALYSGRSVDDVSQPATRDQLKAQLLGDLQKAYGPEVMDVYLTDYVTQ